MLATRFAAVPIVVLVGLAGCAKDSADGVYPVRGKILYNGRPVANAQVTFHPVNDATPKGVRPVGKVDKQGQFALTSFKDGDGAPAGEYRVTVVWYLARQTRPVSDETASANYLPPKYASVETSNLSVTVTPGTNELRPFELK
jgi:hypothetical protein